MGREFKGKADKRMPRLALIAPLQIHPWHFRPLICSLRGPALPAALALPGPATRLPSAGEGHGHRQQPAQVTQWQRPRLKEPWGENLVLGNAGEVSPAPRAAVTALRSPSLSSPSTRNPKLPSTPKSPAPRQRCLHSSRLHAGASTPAARCQFLLPGNEPAEPQV